MSRGGNYVAWLCLWESGLSGSSNSFIALTTYPLCLVLNVDRGQTSSPPRGSDASSKSQLTKFLSILFLSVARNQLYIIDSIFVQYSRAKYFCNIYVISRSTQFLSITSLLTSQSRYYIAVLVELISPKFVAIVSPHGPSSECYDKGRNKVTIKRYIRGLSSMWLLP